MKWAVFLFFRLTVHRDCSLLTCPVTQHFIFEADLILLVLKLVVPKLVVPERVGHVAEVKCCTSAIVVNAEPSNAHVSTRKFV